MTVDEKIQFYGSDSEPCPSEDTKEAPRETYTFQYSREEWHEIFRMMLQPIRKRIITLSVISVAAAIFLWATAAPIFVIGAVLGFLLCCIVAAARMYSDYKKAFAAEEIVAPQRSSTYEVFRDHFTLKVTRNGETVDTLKCSFEDIVSIQTLGDYLMLQLPGRSCFPRISALAPDSAFFNIPERTPEKVEQKKPDGTLRAVSVLLSVLSFLSIMGAMMGASALTSVNHATTENMWVFFLFLPIPIASIVFGYHLKKKGYKHKTNVIVGVIMALLLCIYGSFSITFADLYSHDDEDLVYWENAMNIDIPQHSTINTRILTNAEQSMPRGHVDYISDVYFNDDAVKQFESDLPYDEKWLSEIPNGLVGITSYYCDIEVYDYCLIYNTASREFNTLPDESGTYFFINLLYNAESNTMKLINYKIEYSK